MNSNYEPRCSVWAMNSIIYQLINESDRINLEPHYQRKVIWDDKKKNKNLFVLL